MGPGLRLRVLSAAALGSLLLLAASPAAARVLLTQPQALALAFADGGKPERRTAYLTEAQRQAAEESGRVKIDARVWPYYVGVSSRGVTGYAYFDTHVVRSMPETLMVVLEPGGEVRAVEVLSFLEPDDYLPNARWLAQFRGKALKDDLVAHRGVRNLGGASLTSQAAADAVRRVLAVHAAAAAPVAVQSPPR